MISTLLTQARTLAEQVHQEETDRLGVPYIYHVADVAKRCQCHGEEVEITAWLHDVIESSKCDQRQNMSDEVMRQFGPHIHKGVWAMTRLEPPLLSHKEDFHAEYMQRVVRNPLARLVKAADLSHNISKLWLMQDDDRCAALYDQYARGLQMLDLDPIALIQPIKFVDDYGWAACSESNP